MTIIDSHVIDDAPTQIAQAVKEKNDKSWMRNYTRQRKRIHKILKNLIFVAIRLKTD